MPGCRCVIRWVRLGTWPTQRSFSHPMRRISLPGSHCRSTAVKKWGSANGLGRYRCKQCGVTFNALTGTPLAQLHKRELWAAHAQTLVEGISLRKVAERIGVDLTTAFRWRHRFLQAPKALKAKRLASHQ